MTPVNVDAIAIENRARALRAVYVRQSAGALIARIKSLFHGRKPAHA